MRPPGPPLLHFLVMGAVLFGFERILLPSHSPPPVEVILPAGRVEPLLDDWSKRVGRAATPEERAAFEEALLDEEILVREALRLGLEEDPVVQRRLIRNQRFLGAPAARSDRELLGEARGLGMETSDPVVRRRLAQRMEQRLREPGLTAEPGEAELEAHLRAKADRFTNPARVQISQIFFRGGQDDGHRRARAHRRQLLARGAGAEAAREPADPFPTGADLSEQSEAELAKLFGPELARRALALAPRRWSEPIPSPYGMHLLWLHHRVGPERPPLASIRNRVRRSLLEARAERAFQQGLLALRARYRAATQDAGSSRPENGPSPGDPG
ncbi:MAG: peptidylprolyl isomerase [Myxococcota bacterium]